MADWKPIFVLPNLYLGETLIECEVASLAAGDHPRVRQIIDEHDRFGIFLSKFSNQYQQRINPTVLLLRTDAAGSYYNGEALAAFRDSVSLSSVPYARANRMLAENGDAFSYSTAFQFYPWMIDKNYHRMLLINDAQMAMHILEQFEGQSFPEQSVASLRSIDETLLQALLTRWVQRFSGNPVEREQHVLFRSLNMANEASRMPAITSSVFYDVGRSIALWVSAFEILAHPGDDDVKFDVVASVLESVEWIDPRLSALSRVVPGKGGKPKPCQIGTWLCKEIYKLRNDFLHGNDVVAEGLLINGRPAIDYAACIYRMLLTGFLGLKFREPPPPPDHEAALNRYVGKRMRFGMYQSAYERGLLTAVGPPPELDPV